MRHLPIILCFLCLALLTCQTDDELNDYPEELSIAEFTLALATAKDRSNLITEIDETDELYSVHFESGNSVSIKTDLVQSYDLDSAAWLATFVFSDQSVQTVWFLSELQINEKDVTLNPYVASPLTALANLETPVKGKFKVVVKGKPSNGVAIEKTFENDGVSHELPILGLYENYTNQVEFIFMNSNHQSRCSQTTSIPVPAIANKPDLDFQIFKNQLSSDYHGLFTVFNSRIGFDQSGDVRWYYSGEGANFFTKLKNGNFISSSADNLSFYEVSMLGQTIRKYNVPNGMHHEIIEMPDGNFLVASHSPPSHPLEDVVVELSRTTGQVVKTWDFNFILDPLRNTLPDAWTGDWLHINAMYFDPADNSIVISGRSQSAVVKIDYATSSIKWILGNHNYWNESFHPFLLKPVNANGLEIDITASDFWFESQHAIQKTSEGNVLLYDNGDYRGFYNDPTVPQKSYSRLAEYKINEQFKTVQLVWQFDNNKSLFTQYTGYAQELPETNSRLAAYMWVSENTPRIIEIDANDQVIFEATLKQGNAIYYRVYKVDVYSGIE